MIPGATDTLKKESNTAFEWMITNYITREIDTATISNLNKKMEAPIQTTPLMI